ncbi:CLIP-associating protein 1-like protein [Dinothrombium tinctorium]|uniref:CLIP-associating protein 1-like protein n=1 Tax=Dinothrombium tinctorium TaxID=1965070 RepID=A0A3S3PDA5_9ACAR|nr:CLIP-associating protein 1-like protein [Dinothrombium tinctorium]RWS12966.1 CLIP-associating protein 1-like protein [Dinothrombium tinctorium]
MSLAKTNGSKRATSAPPIKRNAFTTPKLTATSAAGAVNEEMFISCFEDVPRTQIFTSKDLELELNKIKDTLSDTNMHWEKRLESLKQLRALLIAGAADHDKFYPFIKLLELPFQQCVKDLRSQIVREACITIAYLSQRVGIKLDRFCEMLLPTLINLIQNSAKIMSTSGIVTIRFIIQYTHSARLIPIITYNLSSKSKEIRKACCEFLVQLLHTWPTHTLEKHIGILQEAIKKGINDADPEARAFSRKAFWGFASHFKEQADCLLNSLDNNKQRMLYDEQLTMSSSNSINSLQSVSSSHGIHSTKRIGSSVSTSNSVENLSRPLSSLSGMMRNRSGIPVYAVKTDNSKYPAIKCATCMISSRTLPSPLRSTSAIDVGAARRAKVRAAMNAAMTQPKVTVGSSLTRSASKKVDSSSTAAAITSPERVSRTKVRVSQSQPSSRSTSPSLRLSYHTMMQTDGRVNRGRRKSGIPLSTSRETSPNRLSYVAMERRLSSGSSRVSKMYSGTSEKNLASASPFLAERMLQQSREAEAAMADALGVETAATRRKYNFDDHSDESETSSVCSDRSFGSFGGRNVEDVSDIIRNLSSSHWSDRKEGLLGLQFFLRHSPHSLSAYELKRITDMFTKMLLDPHTKTFTLFLEILNELIQVYKQELNGWLYVLMTRLFLKMGTDTLGSVQSKILKTFELIRESFLCQDQFNVIIRFLSDQTQTPNVKVKVTVLQYLHHLCEIMDPNDLTNGSAHELQLSLMKIIAWTADPKSQDLRKQALEVILDLFNLNTSEFSGILNHLPKTYQDAAFQAIKMRRRYNSESNNSTIESNNLQTPSLLKASKNNSKCTEYDYDDTENLNPEEIYNSLRQTTAEIQKYNFNVDSDLYLTSSSNVNKISEKKASPTGSPKKTTVRDLKELSSASQDSGISQIDGSSSNHKLSPSPPTFSTNSSPSKNGRLSSIETFNETDSTLNCFTLVFDNLSGASKDVEFQKEILNEMIDLIRNADSDQWAKHFKEALRILLEKISKDESSVVRSFSLKVMCELLLKQTEFFGNYIELTILRLLDACRDPEKEVQRAAEICAGTAATVLPPEQCLRVLKSVITTGELPLNQHAIKMLNKLVEKRERDIVIKLLPEMMPALIQAYDNSESAVRKAAVLCMVAINNSVGDEMKPYLTSLNVSKMKLLKLYIDRDRSKSSASNSSCNSPISSSYVAS